MIVIMFKNGSSENMQLLLSRLYKLGYADGV
jgi:hypothetical protein